MNRALLKAFRAAAFVSLVFLITSIWGARATGAGGKLDVLIVDGQSNHDWEQTTAAIKAALLNTGRFNVDRSTAPAPGAPPAQWTIWRPQFANYDVVISVYKGEMWPTEVRTAFEDYVAGGGGAVIFHAPLATFFNPHLNPGEEEWNAYSNMLGLGWRDATSGQRLIIDDTTGDPIVFPPPFGGSSNHGAQHSFTVKSRRPSHPIMNGLPTEWLHGKDELYHAMRGPAQNIEVLASAFSDLGTGGTGAHEPMVWTEPFGAGRVVTTAMGHRWFGSGYGDPGTPAENGPDALHCAGFQTLIVRSAEWAATGAVTVPVPPAFPSTGVSIVDPLRGVWLKLLMKINGQHPSSDLLLTPGPVQLTLDMKPGPFGEPLDLYFAFAYQGQLLWLTQAGLSQIPARLLQTTPVSFENQPVLNLNLPTGASITFIMFFAQGSTVLDYDLISAVRVP